MRPTLIARSSPRATLLALLAALPLVGCEAAPARPEPGRDHPASPHAPEAPVPDLDGAPASPSEDGDEEGGR
ncbi:MAG: hypothetical protein ACK57N_00665 [Planctomycetia bacterium]|jgi:hypothetical protein